MKRLFWDIETSPNVTMSWRVGRKIHLDYSNIILERAIICIAYKWEGEKKVDVLEWNKGCDKKLLKEFSAIALDADELIAHNGDKFDMRWFNTRNIFHGLPALPRFKTVDTLKIARSNFYFNSNRLDYLGQFLGLGNKIKTEFGLWKDICQHNCPEAMSKMVRYAKQDVKLLQAVWEKINAYHPQKTHVGTMMGRSKWTCPHDGSKNVSKHKLKFTAAGTRQRQMQCLDCGHYYTINAKAEQDYEDND